MTMKLICVYFKVRRQSGGHKNGSRVNWTGNEDQDQPQADTADHLRKYGIIYHAAYQAGQEKLQLLHVLKNTDLALLYEKAPFPVFSLEEYCDFVVTSIEHLPPEMVIHRLTGDGPRSLLIAPLWSTDKKRVLNTIRKRFQERDTWQWMMISPRQQSFWRRAVIWA